MSAWIAGQYRVFGIHKECNIFTRDECIYVMLHAVM